MEIHKIRFPFALAGTLVSSLACLLGCASNSSAPVLTNPSLAVADTNNARVLLYSSPIPSTGGASLVLGQRDFLHSGANQGTETPAANTFNNPSSVARDAAGNLYVADSGNSRVLIFRPPFSTGMNASVVIGQPDFTSRNVGSTATALGTATSVAIDGNGNLWVADDTNDRVSEYMPPFTNGMAATLAIGQVSTGASQGCYETTPTATTLCYPSGMSFDPAGDLWLSDSDNNRVLEFRPPFSSGMAASLELGQPATTAFVSKAMFGTSVTSLTTPVDLAFDSSGNLWVADLNSNRVVQYAPPFTNGMAAAMVLGQADFTHGDPNQSNNGPAANSLSAPWGLAFDRSGNLNVTDAQNNRVLVFAPPFTQGASASAVIGQPNFTVGTVNQGVNEQFPTANTFLRPLSLSTF